MTRPQRVLALSGWAMKPELMRHAVPSDWPVEYVDYLAYDSAEAVFEHVNGQHVDVLIGWSLGAVLALDCLAQKKITAKMLVLIAPALKLVGQSVGMEAQEFSQFQAQARKNAHAASTFFAKRNIQAEGLSSTDMLHKGASEAALLYWLDYLCNGDIHKGDIYAFEQCYAIFGADDALLPATQMEWMMNQPDIIAELLPNAGHAPMLNQAAMCQNLLQHWWSKCL